MASTRRPGAHPAPAPNGHDHDDHDHRDHHRDHVGSLRERVLHLIRPHSHIAADMVDPVLESSARGIRAVKISLVGLGLTAALQLVIVMISGSVALLADTIHNFSDALTAVPLWIAFVLGRRPPTRSHTYGFGRAEDMAGLFVIAMIALSAVVAGYQAVTRLVHPAPVTNLGWVALAGFVGFLGNEAVAVFRMREGRAIGSAALIADGQHARSDGLTSLAVLLGAGGVAIGWDWADPVIGLIITVAIVAILWTAGRGVLARLMDAVEPGHVADAEAALTAMPGVGAVSALRLRWIGHVLHADAEVDVDPDASLTEADDLARRLSLELVAAVPALGVAAVHPRPAGRPN